MDKNKIIKVCCYCKKVRVDDEKPNDPESWQVADFDLEDRSYTLSHGARPTCFEKVSAAPNYRVEGMSDELPEEIQDALKVAKRVWEANEKFKAYCKLMNLKCNDMGSDNKIAVGDHILICTEEDRAKGWQMLEVLEVEGKYQDMFTFNEDSPVNNYTVEELHTALDFGINTAALYSRDWIKLKNIPV